MEQNQSQTVRVPVEDFQPHLWHLDILRRFDDKLARFFILNWHRRARKTTLGVNLCIRESVTHPKEVYGYIAPTYKQAKSIIWRDPQMLQKYLPMQLVKRVNDTEMFVEFLNGSIFAVKGADDPDSLKGMAFKGVFCDEWALHKPEVWEKILRPVIAEKKGWAMFAFTPNGQNHAYEYWNNCLKWVDWFRSELKVSRSGLISKEELIKVRQEGEARLDTIYQTEYECEFISADSDRFTMIPLKWIEALMRKESFPAPLETRRIIYCDPATGGDECIIGVMENGEVLDQRALFERDSMKIAAEIKILSNRTKINELACDVIGVGKGICDRAAELKMEVNPINSSEKSNNPLTTNRRSEMWWYVMEQIQNKKLPYPEDPELRRQLSATRFRPKDSNGRIGLEEKKETKQRLGRSPDRADAYVYGVYGLQFVKPTELHEDRWSDAYRKKKKDNPYVGPDSWMVA